MGLSYMTKQQKLFKGIIKADLMIVQNYGKSDDKAERLLAAYHMQQAVEKTIKLKAELAGVNLWGHDISKLIQDCKKHNIYGKVSIPKYIEDRQVMITKWEANCRYYPMTVIRRDSIMGVYRECSAWLNSGDTV